MAIRARWWLIHRIARSGCCSACRTPPRCRHHRPAWLACFLNHIAGHEPAIPHEIKGVTRRALLESMRDALNPYASNPLRCAIEDYGDLLLEMLTCEGSDSLADIVAWIQRR